MSWLGVAAATLMAFLSISGIVFVDDVTCAMNSFEATGRHLTVIGAGPKAVALAAKRQVLGRNKFSVPDLAVFDEVDLAAHWSGVGGYTNGELPLGTPPEKDVGFPYLSRETGDSTTDKRINAEMLDYSWAAFNVVDEGRNFAEWIDRGRPSPPHRVWAAYLRWVAGQVGLGVQRHRLTGIALAGERWKLEFDRREPIETDGLVITGPGPPKDAIRVHGTSSQVYDGRSFWTDPCMARVRECAESNGRAAVIGSGETAASIVVELAQQSPRFQIDILSREGIIYSRGESYEENRLYSDPGTWSRVPLKIRENFVARTDRGVFSVANKATLNNREHVSTRTGEVEWIDASSATGGYLVLKDKDPLGPYDLVVDATGFARDWFLEIMDEKALAALVGVLPTPAERSPCRRAKDALGIAGRKPEDEQLVAAIGADLAVERLRPLLHLPVFAGLGQGPGFPSLGCLGTLSDRILRPYWHPQAVSA